MYNEKAIALFQNWEEALIWSCLQGYMGTLITDEEMTPESAIVINGDFSFCAGIPSEKLLKSIPVRDFMLIAANNEDWYPMIEHTFGKKAKKTLRYAIKKEPDIFDKDHLKSIVESLDEDYEIRQFDGEVFELERV